MLSICIPHYNFPNPKLFAEIKRQCTKLLQNFEVIIMDDASAEKHKLYLDKWKDSNFKIVYLPHNIGRAAIRNKLAEEAIYEWLLFLDGDSEIDNPDFLSNYLNSTNADIVSGGRSYSKVIPATEYQLHWNYGSKIESQAKTHFHSHNFLIKKSAFSMIRFDTSIRNYGYEDIVFGLDAKNAGLKLIHIDNPVIHTHLKNSAEFIADTKQALQNLMAIGNFIPDLHLEKEVNIVYTYQQLKKWKLTWLFNIFNQKILNLLSNRLENAFNRFNNKIFILFKLYYFHHLVVSFKDDNHQQSS